MLKRRLQTTDCKLCRPRFVGSRISTVSFRETLTNSFMTYHAIDFDKYPILRYYAVIFSFRRNDVFSLMKFYFTPQWT